MTSEAELKVEIFRLIDTQREESLREVYTWLSNRLQSQEVEPSVEQGYKRMAADEAREQEAAEWIEGTLDAVEL